MAARGVLKRRNLSKIHGQHHILNHRQGWQQLESLKHHPKWLKRHWQVSSRFMSSNRRRQPKFFPAVLWSSPENMLISVVLTTADLPVMTTIHPPQPINRLL